MKKKVIVTGGCGYIGSHTIVDLIENGYEVVSVDSLVTSDGSLLEGVREITGKRVKNYQVDLCDWAATYRVFEENADAVGVIHFAALILVGESVKMPLLYHHNNLNSLMNVLKAMRDFRIPNLIFSSSCSVYGNVEQLPVTEHSPVQEAESAYARTKQIGEGIIRDFARAYPFVHTVLLRYFNPAGAHKSIRIGEIPHGERHLIPIITEVASGVREKMMVFGDDYDTRDGSCVRDYIYIMDLANGHTKALQYLEKGISESNCEVFNLGSGEGVTVLEAIRAFEKVNEMKLKCEISGRRAGDVVAIYADNAKARAVLGWHPTGSIEDIMQTAWAWQGQLDAKK